MATSILNFVADSQSSVKMKWKEPYVTEGLNKMFSVVTPRGIYKGFRLGTSGVPMTVMLHGDPTTLDHVAIYTESPALSTAYTVAIRRVGGDIPVDLSAFPSTTVVLCVEALYLAMNNTTANLNAYTYSAWLATPNKNELVVIGMVDVPASGAISITSIREDFRVQAWDNEAGERVEWSPLLRNGSFEEGILGAHALGGSNFLPYWCGALAFSAGNTAIFSVVSGGASAASRRQLQLQSAGSGVVTVSTFQLNQDFLLEVVPGQRLRVVGQWQAGSGSGNLYVNLYFQSDETAAATSQVVASVPLVVTGTPSSGWVTIDWMVAVPIGMGILQSVQVQNLSGAAVIFAAGGAGTVLLQLDDLQVFVEPLDCRQQPADVKARDLVTEGRGLILRTHPYNYASRDVLLSWSSDTLNLLFRDESNHAGVHAPSLNVPGGIVAGQGWNADVWSTSRMILHTLRASNGSPGSLCTFEAENQYLNMYLDGASQLQLVQNAHASGLGGDSWTHEGSYRSARLQMQVDTESDEYNRLVLGVNSNTGNFAGFGSPGYAYMGVNGVAGEMVAVSGSKQAALQAGGYYPSHVCVFLTEPFPPVDGGEAVPGALYATNIPKAWAHGERSSVDPYPFTCHGFNLTCQVAAVTMTFSFVTGAPDTNYSVVVTGGVADGTFPLLFHVDSRGEYSFVVSAKLWGGTSVHGFSSLNFNTSVFFFDVQVFANQ